MTELMFDRHREEIVVQTDLLREAVAGADMGIAVPSCPGWTVRDLVRHVGAGHRWVDEIVRARRAGPLDDADVRDVGGPLPEDVDAWLAEGARQLSDALAEAGVDGPVWSVAPGGMRFWARRFAHETVVHRADAVLALGQEFVLATDVAVDGVDEWMDLMALPWHLEHDPTKRELLGPGRTLHFHATDTDAEWLADLTGEVISVHHAHEKAAVEVRGAVTDLLLHLYHRRGTEDVDVLGDRDLLDFWTDRVGFG
ncbi:maleylpyruvate isomerase family mycothiol-dependent enzyme [Saccharothrix violaceirubra]|uniref:Uncharacterized protein (TIGR03083 family) n=1 Tax=Saccharothrix violaceirubra TaxID=413306 RepID=A0A7W7T068_9PSEU|nr:maleylpyruvate isomerase family mycothiol-dependent enzyme [Saccharothrix violaceirubra]MBB4964178.1 uncharacterized protein (TIGR03083 family) [Saccharothrix violaceirubra]